MKHDSKLKSTTNKFICNITAMVSIISRTPNQSRFRDGEQRFIVPLLLTPTVYILLNFDSPGMSQKATDNGLLLMIFIYLFTCLFIYIVSKSVSNVNHHIWQAPLFPPLPFAPNFYISPWYKKDKNVLCSKLILLLFKYWRIYD